MTTKTVRTLSPVGLQRAADELLAQVERSGFVPDVLVGIETGGVHVVQALSNPPPLILSCRLVRPSTQMKQSSAGQRLLRVLPYAITNRLRLLEDWMGSRAAPTVPPTTQELKDGIAAVGRTVAERGCKRVLIVDDAVDSGGTLARVLRDLGPSLPVGTEVRSAVLTRTRPATRTAVEPDFALYSMVLLRFPWSFDYKDHV